GAVVVVVTSTVVEVVVVGSTVTGTSWPMSDPEVDPSRALATPTRTRPAPTPAVPATARIPSVRARRFFRLANRSPRGGWRRFRADDARRCRSLSKKLGPSGPDGPPEGGG